MAKYIDDNMVEHLLSDDLYKSDPHSVSQYVVHVIPIIENEYKQTIKYYINYKNSKENYFPKFTIMRNQPFSESIKKSLDKFASDFCTVWYYKDNTTYGGMLLLKLDFYKFVYYKNEFYCMAHFKISEGLGTFNLTSEYKNTYLNYTAHFSVENENKNEDIYFTSAPKDEFLLHTVYTMLTE